jgi:hypothetical protein
MGLLNGEGAFLRRPNSPAGCLTNPSSIAAGGAGHASSLSDQEGPRLPYLKLLNRDDTKTEVRAYPPQFKSGEVIYPYEKAIVKE